MRKTIHFRSIDWFGHAENTVNLLHHVLQARPLVENTRFAIGHEHCEVRHRADQNGVISLHLATYVEGARKGVSPRAIGDHNGDLIDASAPPNTEFTERELAIVVRGSQLGYIAHGFLRAPFVEKIIRELLRFEHGAELANRFSLSAKANEEALENLLNEGVTSLDLGLTLPHVEAGEQVEAQPHSLGHSLAHSIVEALSARLMADHDENEIERLAHANARLVLNFNRRAPLEQIASLTAVAREAIEDDEEFKIKTRLGNDFSRDQLLVRGQYNQPGLDHMIEYIAAWQAIREFLDGLQ